MKSSALLLFVVSACGQAQQPTVAAAAEPNDPAQLETRIGQLMESTAAVIPGMGKASAALAENTRQTLSALQATPNNSALTYDFLMEARGYLALLDTMPKPNTLNDAARRQFVELRDDVERLDNVLRSLLDRKELQLRNPDRDDLRRYSDANAKLNPPKPPFPRVVFLGASIIEFWRLNEYFTGRDYQNRGIGGQVTGEMLGRLKADVIDLHPRAVLILGGSNDIARGVDITTIENNLSMIGDLCRANHIIPLFASVLPVSDYHKRENPRFDMVTTRPSAAIADVNRWMREYCAARGFVYVDYWSTLKDTNGMLPADLSDDGLHPNAKGYRVMAPVTVKALDEALSEKSPVEQPPAKKRRTLFGQ